MRVWCDPVCDCVCDVVCVCVCVCVDEASGVLCCVERVLWWGVSATSGVCEAWGSDV